MLLVAVFCVAAAVDAPGALQPAGVAERLAGSATVEREGRAADIAGKDSIFVGDRVRTGAKSSVELVLRDGSRIAMAANTEIEIAEYRFAPVEKARKATILLVSGKALFAVRDLSGFQERRFRVETRAAVVGSRDTEFVVGQKPEAPRDAVCRGGLVEALCIENTVVVYGRDFPDRPVLLAPGMISQVCGRNPPTPPRFAGPIERSGILAGLEQAEWSRGVSPRSPGLFSER